MPATKQVASSFLHGRIKPRFTLLTEGVLATGRRQHGAAMASEKTQVNEENTIIEVAFCRPENRKEPSKFSIY